MRRTGAVLGAVALLVGLSGCAWPPGDADPPRTLPDPAAGFDYQLGGAYDPPAGAGVIARDSTADPGGDYAICYVNGFQTQPGESDEWRDDLLLRDADGEPVADPGWPDEFLLDTSTEDKRIGIGSHLADTMESCAARGFQAIEFDNLDSYTRSDGALTIEDNIALAEYLTSWSHYLGLAVAQKNGAGDSQRFRDEAGFDFAVTEECMRYDECGDYLDAYDVVLDIEYGTAAEFAEYCALDHPPSMILRDLDLVPAGDPGYVYETC